MQPIKTVTIFGAGLSGAWLLLALRKLCPEVSVRLFEKSGQVDRQKTWSFHESDLQLASSVSDVKIADVQGLVFPYISNRWPDYDVNFSSRVSTIALPYASIRGHSFFEQFLSEYSRFVEFNTSKSIASDIARAKSDELIFDCTGQLSAPPQKQGFQKFFGMELHVPSGHGVERPVVMDTSLAQDDGLTFMYLLPWTASNILVELTKFSPSSPLDEQTSRRKIQEYATNRGWNDVAEVGCERGNLPIPLIGSKPQEACLSGVASLGMAGGLFHPATGFSFGSCIASVMFVTKLINSHQTVRECYEQISRFKTTMWKRGGYYRLLNNMQILGADDAERLHIYEQFYTRPTELISRFYAGELTPLDKIRILSGKPPMSIRRAVGSWFGKNSQSSS
jgi:lycopene beta-cyclase